MIRALFDFSFSSFVTSRLARFGYGCFVVAYGVFAVIGAIALFPIGLLVSPIAFLLLTASTRIAFELSLVIFRIAEDIQKVADRETVPYSAVE